MPRRPRKHSHDGSSIFDWPDEAIWEWFETESWEFTLNFVEWHERLTKQEEERSTYRATEIPEVRPTQRKAPLQKQAVNALRWIVENDPWFLIAQKRVHELAHAPPKPEIESKIGRTLTAYDDFYLTSVEVLANKIERCSEGLTVGYPCGSYWCPKCRKRFGMKLLDQARTQVNGRYRENKRAAGENLRFGTILCDIVIPDPHVVWNGSSGYFATYDAAEKRRDHLDIRRYLKLWQNEWRQEAYKILDDHKIPRAILWTTVPPLTQPRLEDITMVGEKLVRFNADIVESRKRFGRKKTPPKPPDDLTFFDREAFERDEYLWSLRDCDKLSWEEVYLLSLAMLVIHREFPGITKTRFPARLKLKSSVEKVIRRERKKLYTILRDLKDIGILGAFELELIDLKHVIGGDHSKTRKADTVRILAGQERPQAKKQRLKGKLRDEVLADIAADKLLADEEAPRLRYAILVHMHVLVDLNGTPEADIRKWLTGEGPSKRRFKGHWKMPYQVNLKSLYQNRPVDVNLAGMCHYVVKAPTALNYDLPDQQNKDESARMEVVFSEEELGLLVWLQQSVGHEGLRIDLNWQQAAPSLQPGRGRRPKQYSLMKELSDEARFRSNVLDRLEAENRSNEASLLDASPLGQIEVPLNEFFVDVPLVPLPTLPDKAVTLSVAKPSRRERKPASQNTETAGKSSDPPLLIDRPSKPRNPRWAFAWDMEEEIARQASQETKTPTDPEAEPK